VIVIESDNLKKIFSWCHFVAARRAGVRCTLSRFGSQSGHFSISTCEDSQPDHALSHHQVCADEVHDKTELTHE
jgi:hypothetical protein